MPRDSLESILAGWVLYFGIGFVLWIPFFAVFLLAKAKGDTLQTAAQEAFRLAMALAAVIFLSTGCLVWLGFILFGLFRVIRAVITGTPF